MLWIAAISVAGVLIGITGIGGVLVVPALHDLRGVDFHAAIAVASLAFGVPGALAFWRLRRGAAFLSCGPWLLIVCTVPGALAGGQVVHVVPTTALLASLGLATLVSGLIGLAATRTPREAAELRPAWACGAGCLVGFGSAVTGTGGPVMLWPVLLAMRTELKGSLLIAQAIQLPIALCTSVVHWRHGGIDWRLAATVGAILLAGVAVGQSAAMRLPASVIRVAVCMLLVATGCFYLVRSFVMHGR